MTQWCVRIFLFPRPSWVSGLLLRLSQASGPTRLWALVLQAVSWLGYILWNVSQTRPVNGLPLPQFLYYLYSKSITLSFAQRFRYLWLLCISASGVPWDILKKKYVLSVGNVETELRTLVYSYFTHDCIWDTQNGSRMHKLEKKWWGNIYRKWSLEGRLPLETLIVLAPMVFQVNGLLFLEIKEKIHKAK